MNAKKKILIACGSALAVILIIISILIFKPYSVKADQQDLAQIKQELQADYDAKLKKQQDDYNAKFNDQQKKIDSLNTQLTQKETELKQAIAAGDKAVENKITYGNVEQDRQDQMKKSGDAQTAPASITTPNNPNTPNK